jgi:hypothetical protein
MRRITLWGLALVTALGTFSVSHPLLGQQAAASVLLVQGRSDNALVAFIPDKSIFGNDVGSLACGPFLATQFLDDSACCGTGNEIPLTETR